MNFMQNAAISCSRFWLPMWGLGGPPRVSGTPRNTKWHALLRKRKDGARLFSRSVPATPAGCCSWVVGRWLFACRTLRAKGGRCGCAWLTGVATTCSGRTRRTGDCKTTGPVTAGPYRAYRGAGRSRSRLELELLLLLETTLKPPTTSDSRVLCLVRGLACPPRGFSLTAHRFASRLISCARIWSMPTLRYWTLVDRGVHTAGLYRNRLASPGELNRMMLIRYHT